ncbi:MAG TPA: hypothetical protein VF635_09190 [Propionibacteriaceae bacterium]
MLTGDLQGLGFACSDQDRRAAVLLRLCTTSNPDQSGRLLLSAVASSGQLTRVTVDARDAASPRVSEIASIRACSRTSGGYPYELWAQGKSDTIRRMDLSVTSTHRWHTRERYAGELGALLTALETPQTTDLAEWVSQTRGAPGADAFVGGVNVTFTMTSRTYTKGTRASITSAPCGLQPAGAVDPCRVEE